MSLQTAITELETRLETLDAEREALRNAIELLRGVDGGNGAPASTRRRGPVRGARPRRTPPMRVTRNRRATNGDGADRELADTIKAALQRGAATPRELKKHVKAKAWTIRRTLKTLVASGEVEASGSTNARRFALPGRRTPAKEAP